MAKMRFERDLVGELGEAIRRMPDLIHVLVGARQTGKSTAKCILFIISLSPAKMAIIRGLFLWDQVISLFKDCLIKGS